ncbi:MAG: hypothetical protein ISS71_05495 [Phycisphaerae bacterium]|nr:hypothetical protein [Phycisphaerae bacterium]
MFRRRKFLYLLVVVCYCLPLEGAVFALPEKEELYSESTAELFVQQARQIYHQDPLNPQTIEQAMLFLNAALALDQTSVSAAEQILRIGAANSLNAKDYSESITWALDRQVDVQADLHVLTESVRYLLEQQNSRLDREVLLEKLLKKYVQRNKTFASDLALQLGLLSVEKADSESALDWLSFAYELNRYNQLAFVKLQELSSGQALALKPEVYLVQLRLAIDLDPYNLNHALLYADTLKRMQLYEMASQVYEYAAQVYALAYPKKPLDETIFSSWILCCYHAPRQASKCIRITDQYRDPERYDLMLEAVAGRTALKLGQIEKAKTVLEAAGKKVERLLSENGLFKPIYPEQLAWYYSFVLERPEKALAWANQAYKEAPQRQGVQEIFAYTLAQSGQMELAKQYAEPFGQTSQVASLVMAMAAIAAQNASTGLELLKSSIAMTPESFVAEKAMQLLKNQGSDYVLPASFALAETALKEAYKNRIVPEFVLPQNRFSAKLLFNGSEFFYGNEFAPKLIIENTASGPLIISSTSFLRGGLRIDGAITGDLNVELPNLLSMQFRPSRSVLPGEYVSVSLPLEAGKLQKLLQTYPQADVDIQFTVYLDPVEKENGTAENALAGTEPIRGQIHRSGVVITRDFLMQRLDALAKGQQGQQLRAIRLFAGLLAEQKAFETSGADFKYVRVEPSLLADSVRRGLRDENWKIRIQALDNLVSLAIPLDVSMIQDISANLDHEKWPVRLITMVLLARAQTDSFQQVLDWMAQHDPYQLNRRMAFALGAREQKTVTEEPKP